MNNLNTNSDSDSGAIFSAAKLTAAFMSVMVTLIFIIAAIANPVHAASAVSGPQFADVGKSEVISYDAEITCAWPIS